MDSTFLQACIAWGLGLCLGLRHALEPDHLAAVSTLVVEGREGKRAALLGVAWGLGHTAALLAVGGSLALLGTQMPPRVASAFELAVAAVLLTLGGRSLVRAARMGPSGPNALHAHAGSFHRHPGTPGHVHVGRFLLAPRPFFVGLIHGLAGSGALTALVLAKMPNALSRVVYISLFGIGSTLGMGGLSRVLGHSLLRLQPTPRYARSLATVTGGISVVLGAWWALASVRELLV